MIDLQASIGGYDDVFGSMSGLADQIPFATSFAINNTLNDIQTSVRTHVHGAFIMRAQDFIDRTIYIGPSDRAKKTNLVGTVRINPDRDFLAKFEDGGEKTASSAGSLAVPVFREDTPSIIIRRGDPLSIKNLMAAINKQGAAAGRLKRIKGGSQDVQQRVYLVKNDRGTFIVQGEGASARVLYKFVKEVPIQPQLEFVEIAMKTALDRWETNASDAIDFAIATAK
jgi:hypothetical protein